MTARRSLLRRCLFPRRARWRWLQRGILAVTLTVGGWLAFWYGVPRWFPAWTARHSPFPAQIVAACRDIDSGEHDDLIIGLNRLKTEFRHTAGTHMMAVVRENPENHMIWYSTEIAAQLTPEDQASLVEIVDAKEGSESFNDERHSLSVDLCATVATRPLWVARELARLRRQDTPNRFGRALRLAPYTTGRPFDAAFLDAALAEGDETGVQLCAYYGHRPADVIKLIERALDDEGITSPDAEEVGGYLSAVEDLGPAAASLVPRLEQLAKGRRGFRYLFALAAAKGLHPAELAVADCLKHPEIFIDYYATGAIEAGYRDGLLGRLRHRWLPAAEPLLVDLVEGDKHTALIRTRAALLLLQAVPERRGAMVAFLTDLLERESIRGADAGSIAHQPLWGLYYSYPDERAAALLPVLDRAIAATQGQGDKRGGVALIAWWVKEYIQGLRDRGGHRW